MSVNSSSSSNGSNFPQNGSFTHSDLTTDHYCFFFSEPYSSIFTTYAITIILLLLPLCIFILHHGLQQWRQKKRSASSAATVSHSDCFTYHMVAMEMGGVFGSVLLLCSVHTEDFTLFSLCSFLFYFTWYGQMYLHILTCVERYLAVVHPITYLTLRNQRGIRIRNISLACVWLICFATAPFSEMHNFIFVNFCLVTLTLIITSFCSLSVLCVLIRPGPGEQGGGKGRVDQSKLRAFYTIMSIMGVLVLRFGNDLVLILEYMVEESHDCVNRVCELWLNVPCSLVLPLLFLYKKGTFVCCKNNQ